MPLKSATGCHVRRPGDILSGPPVRPAAAPPQARAAGKFGAVRRKARPEPGFSRELSPGRSRACANQVVRKSGRRLRADLPQRREVLPLAPILDGLERLAGFVLLALPELRDAEGNLRLVRVRDPALLQTALKRGNRLVVLAIAEVRLAERHIRLALRRLLGFLRKLGELRLVGRRGLGRLFEQAV